MPIHHVQVGTFGAHPVTVRRARPRRVCLRTCTTGEKYVDSDDPVKVILVASSPVISHAERTARSETAVRALANDARRPGWDSWRAQIAGERAAAAASSRSNASSA